MGVKEPPDAHKRTSTYSHKHTSIYSHPLLKPRVLPIICLFLVATAHGEHHRRNLPEADTAVEKDGNFKLRDERSLNPWYLVYEFENAKHLGTHRGKAQDNTETVDQQVSKTNKREVIPKEKLIQDPRYDNAGQKDEVMRHKRSLNPWYLVYEAEYAKHTGLHRHTGQEESIDDVDKHASERT